MVLMIIGFIVIGIKLRKVHDAFFIKNEFKLHLITILVFGIPALVLSAVPSTTRWGMVLTEVNAIIIAFWSFVIPSIKSYQQAKQDYTSDSSISSEVVPHEDSTHGITFKI